MNAATLFSETFLIARQALAANRMRSVLALLGIVIGVATVIGMGSLINGFERSFEKGIQSFSNGTIYVRPFRPGVRFNGGIPDSLRRRQGFTAADARAIIDQAPAVGAVGMVKLAYDDIRVTRGGRSTRTTQTFGSDVACCAPVVSISRPGASSRRRRSSGARTWWSSGMTPARRCSTTPRASSERCT